MGVELAAVGHLNVQRPLGVVLEMRRFAQLGAGDRFDVFGPAPARLQCQAADLAVADVDQVDRAAFEGARLVWGVEALLLGLVRHGDLLEVERMDVASVDRGGCSGLAVGQGWCRCAASGWIGACTPCRCGCSASSLWTASSPPRWAAARVGHCCGSSHSREARPSPPTCWRWRCGGMLCRADRLTRWPFWSAGCEGSSGATALSTPTPGTGCATTGSMPTSWLISWTRSSDGSVTATLVARQRRQASRCPWSGASSWPSRSPGRSPGAARSIGSSPGRVAWPGPL